MPLRDHFRPPLDDFTCWQGLYAYWPALIVQQLHHLPQTHVAALIIRKRGGLDQFSFLDDFTKGEAGPVLLWEPEPPAFSERTEALEMDEYEVRVFDQRQGRRQIAVIAFVSPADKARPEYRRLFVAKCAALLQQSVCVCIVDLVTERRFNLYADLLNILQRDDPALGTEPPHLYAVSCRWRARAQRRLLETWYQPLTLGQALPTLPLWLSTSFAVPLELEESYEQTCRDLRIP